MRSGGRSAAAATLLVALLAACSPPAGLAPSDTASPVYEGSYLPLVPGPDATPDPAWETPSTVPDPTTPPAPDPPVTPSPSPSPSEVRQSPDRPVIVIDPGHSGRSIRSRTTNGLLDFDYPNHPEITEVFDVSACVAEGLRADGYRVIMTKKRAGDSVSLTERAEIANRARADLAVSVHNDHSQRPGFQATYSQRGVAIEGRYPTMYRGSGSRRTEFDDPRVAKASERAAKIIARERTEAQGRTVTVRQNSFDGRSPLEPGNLALVQLLSDVPWVYNEAGALTGGSPTRRMTLAAETGYAKGMLDGIEAAVPVAGRAGRTSTAELRSCLRARR